MQKVTDSLQNNIAEAVGKALKDVDATIMTAVGKAMEPINEKLVGMGGNGSSNPRSSQAQAAPQVYQSMKLGMEAGMQGWDAEAEMNILTFIGTLFLLL